MRMRFQSLIALWAIESAVAHTVFTTLFVDGVSQGDGTCVRMNQTPDQASYPVEDLTSNDMACGITGETGVSRVCAANQSSTLTFQFRQYPDASQAGVIASSHVGPCAVYLKQVSSAISDPGYGDGWFKIWESGYDEDTQEWCTTKLINAGGLLSVDMPSDLAGGYYLVRPELLALHNANAGDPQFYTGCAQMFLDSDATAVPTETVAIPGYVTKDDPSVTYNIYTTPLSLPYPIPGPSIYEDSVASNIVGKRAAMTQTEGLKPEGCILENANWCGIELDTYTTMEGCWNSSSACWDQDTSCWADAGPVGGSRLCPIWEDHCNSIAGACNVSDFNGPPNAGTNLQPAASTIDLKMVSPSGATSVIGVSAMSTIASSTSMMTSSTSSIASSTSIIASSTSITASSATSVASSAADMTTWSTTTLSTTSILTIWETKTTTMNPSSSSPIAGITPAAVMKSSSQVQSASQVMETDTVYETIWMTVLDYMTEGGGNALVTLTPGSDSGLNSVPVATTSVLASTSNVQSAAATSSSIAESSPQVSRPVAQLPSSQASQLASASFAMNVGEDQPGHAFIPASAPPTTLVVTMSSVITSSSAEKTVTVTQSYCPAETGLSRKEVRKLIRHQAAHERRRAFG